MGNPPARYGHISLNLNGLLFVFSGSIGGNTTGYFFDLTSKQWTQQPLTGDAPTSTMRASVALHEGFVYFYGGYGEKGLSTDLFRLDTTTFVWQRVPYHGEPPCLYGMSTVVHNDTMIVFGGRSVSELLSNDTFALDLDHSADGSLHPHVRNLAIPRTMTWRPFQTFGAPPSKRFAHSAVVSGDRMYVYGGLDVLGSMQPSPKREDGNSLYCLDLALGSWSALTFKGRGPGPGNTIHGETFSLFKNGLLVTLGYQNDRVYILNLDEGRWQCCTLTGDLMGPRMYHSATVFLEQGTVALFGGQNRKLNQDFNDTFLLKLVPDGEA